MTTKRNAISLLLLAICSAAWAQEAAAFETLEDVVFAKVGSRELHMTIVQPKDTSTKTHPCVVWIHGGGWRAGTYKQNRAAWLAERDYVVASVEYRLSQDATFPAQAYDCKAAIRFLRAHAKEYGIDPSRIGVWGSSAGGHLVALLGTTGGAEELEGNEGNPGESSNVQAVCDFYGPTDLTVSAGWTPKMVESLLGGSPKNKPDVARLASPVKFVDPKDPPFLIVHGEIDKTVPISQSEELYDLLRKAGVDATLVRVKNAAHSLKGTNIKPTLREIDAMVLEFFDRQLKAK